MQIDERVFQFSGIGKAFLSKTQKRQRNERLINLTTTNLCCLIFFNRLLLTCHIHGETLTSLGLASISGYHVTSRLCCEKSEASAAPGSEGSFSEPHLRNPRSRAGEVKNEQLTATCAHVCMCARAVVNFPAQDCSRKVRLILDCFKPLCFGVLCHSSADHRNTPSPPAVQSRGPWIFQDSIPSHWCAKLYSYQHHRLSGEPTLLHLRNCSIAGV